MKAKPALLKIHRWLGLALALLLLIQGGTGVAMIFRDEIEPVLHPELRVEPAQPRMSMQQLLGIVQTAHPDAVVNRVEVPRAADQAVLFKLKRESDKASILTAINPYTGEIVRDGGPTTWPAEWLFILHEQLLAGTVGEYVVGFEGIALTLISVAGLWAWWPGRARLRQGFRVVWRGNVDITWRTLHRAAGAAAAPILLATAVTGILIVWKEPLRDALGAEGKPTPAVAEQVGRLPLPLDDLVAKAQAEFGPTPLRQIRFSSGGRVVAVYLDSDRSIRPDGTAQYYYNGYDGRLLGSYIAGEQSMPSEFLDWLYTIHTGLWGGLPARLLLLVGGFVLVALSVTGPWLWYARTRRKATRRSAASAITTK